MGIQIVSFLRLSYHFVYRFIFVGIYLRFIQIQEPVIMFTRQKLFNKFLVSDLWIDGYQHSPHTGEDPGCITTQTFSGRSYIHSWNADLLMLRPTSYLQMKWILLLPRPRRQFQRSFSTVAYNTLDSDYFITKKGFFLCKF